MRAGFSIACAPMKKLVPKGLDFFENPPASMDFEATMSCSAGELFDVLASTEKLGLWLDDFKGVDWLEGDRLVPAVSKASRRR